MMRDEDEVFRVSPVKDRGVPGVPRVPSGVEGVRVGVKVKEEDFEWDDDVF